MRWTGQCGFIYPTVTWSCSKGYFTDIAWNPHVCTAKYHANAGQTGADTIQATLTESGLEPQSATKAVTIYPDHLARDYSNINWLNQLANPIGWGNCQNAVNHAFNGHRDYPGNFHPPWDPDHAFPGLYEKIFDRQAGITTYTTYSFSRGSVIYVSPATDVKTVLADGQGAATVLFGKDGNDPWRTVAVGDFLNERYSYPPYDLKHNYMYIAPKAE